MNFLATFAGTFLGLIAAGLVFSWIEGVATDSDDETT